MDAFNDRCPLDPNKTEPGECGCGAPDVDGDSDGVVDCLDQCPTDPDKIGPGTCGCNNPDTDADEDGSVICEDCDDGNGARAPGRPELCDEVDNDCDDAVDEGIECALEGCADGTREGFLDPAAHPDIAACAGAWDVYGIRGDGVPSCGRAGGNDGTLPDGAGCDVDDLCEEGWHVCDSAVEVAAKSPTGCDGAVSAGATPTFFAAGVSSEGRSLCDTVGDDDLFGCGNWGDTPDAATCGPLDRTLTRPCDVDGAGVWLCDGHVASEATRVRKFASTHGGVLCCRTD